MLTGLEEPLYESKVGLKNVKSLKGSMKFDSITVKEARNPEVVGKLDFNLPLN